MGTANHAAGGGGNDEDDDGEAAHGATRTASYESDEIDHTSSQAIPTRVGRYEICQVLGAGAMGVVYRARDPELDRAVAIKVVRGGSVSSAGGVRLLREAQAMARLRHPNVVPIFDVGPAGDGVFVAMPLIDGGTLRSWLGDHSRSFEAILDRFVAAGRGLAAAHAAGLVHRDFKPDNVLLGSDGGVHVADFGLARLAGDDVSAATSSGALPAGPLTSGTLTQTGTVLGTPAYMAPEQLRGQASDARADQFSFCTSLWEAIYGKRPFPNPRPGTDHPLRARLDAIAAGPVAPRRRDRPAWIAPLLARGLAGDPDQRWPSLQALLDAIAAQRAPRRWPRWLAAAIAVLGLSVAALAIAWPPRTAPTQRFHLTALPRGRGVKTAAISPDGNQLAVVVRDALVIRRIEPEAADRTIVEHGMVGGLPPVWSPDGKRLLAGVVPEIAGQIETALFDLDDGPKRKVPAPGMAVFLSSAEIAVASYRQRSVAIFQADALTAPPRICEVPGDYTFLWDLVGLPDGTMVLDARTGERHDLMFLDRDCRHRGTFSAEQIASIAVGDAGTVVALVGGDGFREIVEIAGDGTRVSRRLISGDLDTVLGRRHGVDYVATRELRTRLERIHDGEPEQVLAVHGGASFSLAPDGDTLAWVELAGHVRERGRLWLGSVRDVSRGQRLVRDNALMAGWSPDGRWLAVLVDDDREVGVVIVDRSGRERRRLPLHHLAREAAPVWLDDHRILVQSEDCLTYRSFDLDTGVQRDAMDSDHGGTYWLARSPRDGTLAMWRNGRPGATGADARHLWLQPLIGPPRPLDVADAVRYHLAPSWSPSGELMVRALETGVLSRVALDTGALTPIAQLRETPVSRPFDNRVMTLAGGDLLAVDVDLAIDLWETAADDNLRPLVPAEPGPNQL
ncbi:MAG TPA: protein kinase [Kofleriaceae bacterium]